MTEMKEKYIQSRIKRRMEENGWLVIKLIQTTYNGIPDLLAIKNGRVVFIEVKADGKRPNLLQALRHGKLRESGVEVYFTSDQNFTL